MIAPSRRYHSVVYEQVYQGTTLRDAWRLVRKGGRRPVWMAKP